MPEQEILLVLMKVTYMICITWMTSALFLRKKKSADVDEPITDQEFDCFICKKACPIGILRQRKLALIE